MSGLTIATSLLRTTRDFLNLSFHMFPYSEVSKLYSYASINIQVMTS